MPTEIPRVLTVLWRQRYQQRMPLITLAERFQREIYRQATPPTNSTSHSAGWKNIGGANMFIGKGGQILAGCPGVKGEDVDSLEDEPNASRDERQQRQDVAQSHGLEGHEVTVQQAQQLDDQLRGQHPTTDQPATIQHRGQFYEVKYDSGQWFWRRPQTQAWTSAGPEGKGGWIEEGLGIAQPQAPQPVPVRKRRRDAGQPRQTLDRAVSAAAQERGVDPDWLKQATKDVYAEKGRELQNREIAKATARQITGLTGGDLARLENSHHDYTSKNIPGPTGDRLRNFDVSAVEVARQYPELGLGNPDDLRTDIPAAVWDLIREGRQAVPPIWHPDIVNEAADRLERDLVAADPDTSFGFGGGPEDFRRRGRVERYRRMFAREFELRRVVERYQSTSSSKAPRFAPDGLHATNANPSTSATTGP